MHEVQVQVVGAEVREGALESLGDALVPRVVEFCGEPDLVAGHAGLPDALADLLLVAVGKGRVDVSVSALQGGFHCFCHLIGLGLPGAEADGGDGSASVEFVGLSAMVISFDTVTGCSVFHREE